MEDKYFNSLSRMMSSFEVEKISHAAVWLLLLYWHLAKNNKDAPVENQKQKKSIEFFARAPYYLIIIKIWRYCQERVGGDRIQYRSAWVSKNKENETKRCASVFSQSQNTKAFVETHGRERVVGRGGLAAIDIHHYISHVDSIKGRAAQWEKWGKIRSVVERVRWSESRSKKAFNAQPMEAKETTDHNKTKSVEFSFFGWDCFPFPTHSPHLFPFITSIFSLFCYFYLTILCVFVALRSKQTDTQRRRKTPLCPLGDVGDVVFVSNKLDLPPHQKIKNSKTKTTSLTRPPLQRDWSVLNR